MIVVACLSWGLYNGIAGETFVIFKIIALEIKYITVSKWSKIEDTFFTLEPRELYIHSGSLTGKFTW